MNKIIKLGCLFFVVVLLVFSYMKYSAGKSNAIFYFISAVGFFIVYLSYRKKEKQSN